MPRPPCQQASCHCGESRDAGRRIAVALSRASSRGSRADDRGVTLGGRARRCADRPFASIAHSASHACVRRVVTHLPSAARTFVPSCRRATASLRQMLRAVSVGCDRTDDGVAREADDLGVNGSPHARPGGAADRHERRARVAGIDSHDQRAADADRIAARLRRWHCHRSIAIAPASARSENGCDMIVG